MRRLIVILFIFSLVSCSSCRKELPLGNSGVVNVSLKTIYGDDPFVSDAIFNYPTTGAIQFGKIYMYLSDIVLLRADGQEISLADLEYLDVMDLQSDDFSAKKGWKKEYTAIPVGEYTGIRFGLGVSQELNSQQPSDFSLGNHALAEEERYSTEFKSYVFADIEGKYHVDGSTTEFKLRVLDSEMLKQIQLMKDFKVSETGVDLVVNFDLKKAFSQADSTIDLVNIPQIVEPSSRMDWFSNNLKFSFSF